MCTESKPFLSIFPFKFLFCCYFVARKLFFYCTHRWHCANAKKVEVKLELMKVFLLELFLDLITSFYSFFFLLRQLTVWCEHRIIKKRKSFQENSSFSLVKFKCIVSEYILFKWEFQLNAHIWNSLLHIRAVCQLKKWCMHVCRHAMFHVMNGIKERECEQNLSSSWWILQTYQHCAFHGLRSSIRRIIAAWTFIKRINLCIRLLTLPMDEMHKQQ